MKNKKIKLGISLFVLIGVLGFTHLVSAKEKYKTYKNTTYGFSFQYPETWRFQEVPFEGGFNLLFDYGKELVSIPDMSTGTMVSMNRVGKDSQYQTDNLEKIAKINVEGIEANRFGSRDLKIRVKNTKMAKLKAKQINYLNSFIFERDMEMLTVVFVKDGYVWSIGGPVEQAGLKQLIKNFKFIPKK